jgi:hypothetical protein
MPASLRSLEILPSVAPLGVRFRDEHAGAGMADGLSVVVYPQGMPSLRVSASPNRSGVWAARGLPGLAEAERGDGDGAYWSGVVKRPFVVEVTDPRDRFVPFWFRADLPHRGLFVPACLSGRPAAKGIPLYSAPARRAPAGLAVVRAQLVDLATRKPAAWAVLEAQVQGQAPARGVADSAGRVAVAFPYPPPRKFTSDTPPVAIRKPLSEHTWEVGLKVFYAPQSPVPASPELCRTLGQPLGRLWADAGGTQPLPKPTLGFGVEVVVRSGSLPVALVSGG